MLGLQGDSDKGIPACANCHGPQGRGEAPNYPYLAGQDRGYLAASLHAWRDGGRNTDASNQMPMIANRLSDADIDAVANYFAALPAPIAAALPQKLKVSPETNAPPTSGATSPTPNVGTEQGAPITGGSEGPGGGGSTQEQQQR